MAGYRSPNLPTGLVEVMNDTSQLELYENFRSSNEGDLHPGFAVKTRFESQRAVFRASSSKQLQIVLSSSTAEFQTSTQQPTWDNVLDDIQAGLDAYNAKATNNPVRRFARSGGDTARILDSMVDLVPDENGLNILKWGLSTVFQIWIARIDNAGRIVDALSEIPQSLSRTRAMWRSYPNDTQLQNMVKDYFDAALDSLTQLLTILNRENAAQNEQSDSTKPHAWRDGTKKFFSRAGAIAKDLGRAFISADTAEIDAILDSLEQSSAILIAHVEDLDRRLGVDTNKTTHSVLREAQAIRMTSHDTKTMVGEIPKQLEAIFGPKLEQSIQTTTAKAYKDGAIDAMEFLRSNFILARRENINALPLGWAEMMQTGFYELISEDEYKRRELVHANMHQEQQPHLLPPAITYTPATFHLTVPQLLDILAVDPELPMKDERSIARERHSMPPNTLTRVGTVMTHPLFRDWLMSAGQSRLLMVEGGDMDTARYSPLSVFCASLAASFSQSPNVIVLDFFCGLHSHPRMEPPGPTGLLRSLISQFLLYPDKPEPDFSLFMDESLYQAVGQHDSEALVYLLEQLLRQVQTKTVIILVDGVSYFEALLHGWNVEFERFADTLLNLVYSPTGGTSAAIKVLMTAANRARITRSRNLLNISLMSDRGGGRAITDRGFDTDLQRLMPPTPAYVGYAGSGSRSPSPSPSYSSSSQVPRF